ncbi:MAG: hypothetical protein QXI58_06450 [Candidatus Micrarchaeia archaeon]
MSEISESEHKKLILAKSFFIHECVHANAKDEISRMLAIHHFDNTVEMVLKCIALKRKIKPKGKFFYFEELLERIPNLPLKEQIIGLHNLRNMIQHHGDIPDFESVIKYKGYTEDFLKEVFKTEFEISFDELTRGALISDTELREIVQKAEKAFENEKYKECIELSEEALIKATFYIGNIFRKAGLLTGYFGAREELKNVINEGYAEKYKEESFYALAKELSKAIFQLGMATTAMQFFDEYKSKFLKHREIINNLEKTSEKKLKEKARFSLEFIIGLIIKWQEEGVI